MREGDEEANEQREKRGFKPLTLDGWSDPPHYDGHLHHLVWVLVVSDEDGKSVNYNTRVLGRRGFVSLNFVTEPERLVQYKPRCSSRRESSTRRSCRIGGLVVSRRVGEEWVAQIQRAVRDDRRMYHPAGSHEFQWQRCEGKWVARTMQAQQLAL